LRKPAHVLCHFFERVRAAVELIEDVNHAATIVSAVVHVGDEEPVVRAQRHEPDSFETLRSDGDLVASRQV
jgi:hypothetical protein